MTPTQGEQGPLGGQTTRRRGQVKKTFWINEEEAEELRKAAFNDRRSEASIVREALRIYFEIED